MDTINKFVWHVNLWEMGYSANIVDNRIVVCLNNYKVADINENLQLLSYNDEYILHELLWLGAWQPVSSVWDQLKILN